jgi:predicted NACHT family NTPase
MREPVSLDQVYTAVQFLGEDLRQFESIEDLEASYRQSGQRRFQSKKCPKQDGLKVANDQQFLMVLGQPGAGKSTFLRRMGLEALREQSRKYKHACIPVMLELRSFNKKEINIEKAIVEEFRTCGFPKPEAATKKLLEKGKLLILLDGLDEVATDQMNDAIRSIQDFVQLHDKNRFIASCRVAAYRGSFTRFNDVAMADFDDEQVRQFIFNWFGADARLAKECWYKLNSAEHEAAKELTQTPLLLALICLLYRKSQKFPTNRSTLYERALRVLLEEWAEEKGIPQQEVYKGLDTKRKEMLLSEIAYKAFEPNRLFIPKRELTRDIEELLKELLPEEKIVDGNAVLRAIEQQHGILVARAEEIYSFSHLTLQEYLTAQYIDDHRQFENLVVNHLTDRRWREVFQLVSGLMRGGSDALLTSMLAATEKLLISDRLKALVGWANWSTVGSIGNNSLVAKRALALALALDRDLAFALAVDLALARSRSLALALALDLDPNLDRDLARNRDLDRDLARDLAFDRNRDLAEELQKLQIFAQVDWANLITQLKIVKFTMPPNDASSEVQRDFSRRIQQTWWKAIGIDPTWFELNEDEQVALNNYLYSNELLIRCKESAVRCSPKVWAEIEARMLTVSNEPT